MTTPPSKTAHSGCFLTLRRAAVETLCSAKTLRREIAAGRLTGYVIGGKILIKHEDLQEYIAAGIIRIGGNQ